MLKRLVILALGSGLLGGCTGTLPVPADIARQASIERIQASSDGDTQITIVRDAGLLTSFCRASVSVNGTQVASLEPGERITLGVEANTPVLVAVVQGGGGGCAWQTSSSRLEVCLRSGQHRFYRVAFTRTGRIEMLEDAVLPASSRQ